jgi:4-diphosphocytidyl-2-C-methyl-D-erythritol kinase
MITRQSDNFIELLAPAKVNFFLELLARRADGFHELETVMSSVSIFDCLRMSKRRDDKIVMTIDSTDHTIPRGEDNLVWIALNRLRMACGEMQGLNVALTKRIPTQAGLGGASSDAAAALIGANSLWNLNWPIHRLEPIAASIGSDVAFFLSGGTAICTGRGERVHKISVPTGVPVVIAKPGQGLSTAEVYQICRVPAQPRSRQELVVAMSSGIGVNIGRLMWNRLEEFAISLGQWIVRIKREFSKTGCLGHQLSGSGSSYFGVFADHRTAKIASKWLSNRLPGVTIFHGHTL